MLDSRMGFFYALPAAVLLLVAIVLAVGAACGGLLVVHRRFNAEVFLAHNDVAGSMVAVVGTLYAVVLGFVTVTVWQQYDATKERLSLEAAAVTDAWHSAVGLPPDVRSRLRGDMARYASDMERHEWPLMRTGRFSLRGDEIIMEATDTVGTFVPRDPRQANAQASTLRILTDLHDARLRRLASNRSGVSWFEWVVLLLGAVAVIAFCYLFGLRNRGVHLLMTAGVALIIASMFAMIFELQYPFRGQLGIGTDEWNLTAQHIRYMQQMSAESNMRM